LVVIVAFLAVRVLGCTRCGVGFECVCGAQRFTFRARGAKTCCYSWLPTDGNSVVWRGECLISW
jgi:hypothetical protein